MSHLVPAAHVGDVVTVLGMTSADDVGAVALETLTAAPWARPLDPRHVDSLVNGRTFPAVLITAEGLIVDGHHRVAAARLRGDAVVGCRVVTGSPAELLELAARNNASNGLPWSTEMRSHTAARLLELEPDWSDRRIASACRVSRRSVASLRAQSRLEGCSTGPAGQLNTPLGGGPVHIERRIGADGKSRPADPAAQRQRIAELLRAEPPLTLEEVKRATQASLNIVRSVRGELEAAAAAAPTPPLAASLLHRIRAALVWIHSRVTVADRAARREDDRLGGTSRVSAPTPSVDADT